MKKNLLLFCLLLAGVRTFAQPCTNLFFSEYVEGTSNNKAVEVYNPTNYPVDLSDYKIYRYNNGSMIASDSIHLMGTLAPQAAYVIGNPASSAAVQALSDTLHNVTAVNGDDALELRQISTQNSLDIFGIIGVDPGTTWPVGTGATAEFTLIRMFNITEGTTDWTVSENQWDVLPQNTFDSLGTHSAFVCCVNTAHTMSASACSSYDSPSGNYTWTISGAYNDTIPNAGGCDSIITINLSINNTFNTITDNSCGDYTLNGTTYTTSGTYTQTIPNAAGCDSIITLNLTIGEPTTHTITTTACNEYVLNGTTYNASGTYTQTLTNAAGCDSTITLNLTINTLNVNTTVTGQTITATATGATYQWITCPAFAPVSGQTGQSFTATANGNYAVVITQGGCSDTSACTTITGIGINEIRETSMFSVYPNPSNGQVTITAVQNGTVLISDLNGKTVAVKTVTTGTNSFDLSQLVNGVYTITLAGSTERIKWIKL